MNIGTGHVRAVKREVEDGRMTPTGSVSSIKAINLDNFIIDFKGGTTNVAELVEIKESIDNLFNGIAYAIDLFINYHPNSPRRVLKEFEREDGGYNIMVDLSKFITLEDSDAEKAEDDEDESGICWNYKDNGLLADQVLSAFAEAGNKVTGIEDISDYGVAMWTIKSKATAKKLSKFIYDNYVKLEVDENINKFNIKKVNFDDEQITFEYKNN